MTETNKINSLTSLYIEELNKLLEKATHVDSICSLKSGQEKQQELLKILENHSLKNTSSKSIFIEDNIKLIDDSPYTIRELNIDTIVLEFLLETLKIGGTTNLKGFLGRLSYSSAQNIIGVEDFNNENSFEYGVFYDSFSEGKIQLSLGTIDILNKEFVINYDYLQSLIINKTFDEKRLKLFKGMAYSFEKGLIGLGYSTNLDMLGNLENSYTYSPVSYSNINTKDLVEGLMLAFYDTNDEGVVYINEEGNSFSKQVGNTYLVLMLEDEVDEETQEKEILISWQLDNYKETTIFDILYENEDLYNFYVGK